MNLISLRIFLGIIAIGFVLIGLYMRRRKGSCTPYLQIAIFIGLIGEAIGFFYS